MLDELLALAPEFAPAWLARGETLRKLEEHYFSDPAPSRSTAITHLILAKGIMNELTWIDWLVQAQRVLARDEPPVQRA